MAPKLLSLNTFHYRRGGSEAVYFNNAALFEEQGWETAYFAQHHPENDPSPWSKYFADEMEFANASGIKEKLSMAGKFIYSFEAKHKLEQLLDVFHPDIAHGHLLYHHLSPSVLAALKERNIPTVMTAHDLKLACPAYKMLNKNGICEKCINGNLLHVIKNKCVQDSLVNSTLVAVESTTHRLFGMWRKNLDSIITPSHFLRNKLIEWGWPPHQLAYIPNYIKPEEFTPQYEPGDYFLYFGRLTLDKGVATLIDAVKNSGTRLLVAGTGPDEDALREMAAGADIEFIGYRSGDNLKRLIREARATVLPSELYENAPISILEAYASGKPVIGSRMGGIPEMVHEGETGLLFESGNTEDLASCLSKLQGMPTTEIEAMGKAGRVYVSATFTREQYLDKMLSLYDSISKVDLIASQS